VNRVVELLQLRILLARDGDGGNAASPRTFEPEGLPLRTDDDLDARRNLPRVDALEEVFETGSSAREQHPEAEQARCGGAAHEHRFR
jgi:hypothetical protein